MFIWSKEMAIFFQKKRKGLDNFLTNISTSFPASFAISNRNGNVEGDCREEIWRAYYFLFMPEMVLLGSLASNEKNTGCESWAKIEFYFHFFTLWHLF